MKKSLFSKNNKFNGICGLCILIMVVILACSFGRITVRARDIARVEIEWNEEELAYIAQNRELRLANFISRAPVSYEEGGELHGISIDIMKWIEVNTGLHFIYLELP